MADWPITMRILGVDPGLNITGYAVVEKRQGRLALIEAGMIRGRSRGDLAARLKEIHEGITDVIASLKPEIMAIEELYSHYERPRTAILMGHARGVICLAAMQADIPMKSYASTQVKRFLTGNGRAPKSQMQRAQPRLRAGPVAVVSSGIAPSQPTVLGDRSCGFRRMRRVKLAGASHAGSCAARNAALAARERAAHDRAAGRGDRAVARTAAG